MPVPKQPRKGMHRIRKPKYEQAERLSNLGLTTVVIEDPAFDEAVHDLLGHLSWDAPDDEFVDAPPPD